MRIFRPEDLYSPISCCGTQVASGPVFLKSGAEVYDLNLDDETVRYQYPANKGVHGVFWNHIITGRRKEITEIIDLSIAIISQGVWMAVLDFNDGRSRVVGSEKYPLRFIGGGDYPEDYSQPGFTSWRFESVSLAPSCFIADSKVSAIGCAQVSNAEFTLGGFTFNGANEFISIPAPTLVSGSIIGSIPVFDDGTIEQISGGAFADTITETGGSYELDGGPIALSPGIYEVTIPMTLLLIDGTPCAFTLVYSLTYTIGCADVSDADFSGITFLYNGSDEFTGFAVPTLTGGIVSSIQTFDDGTIQQISGGSYTDSITETAGTYEPDGGAVLLSDGVYRVSIPMSITLSTGATCGYTLVIDVVVSASIFDPDFFDSNFFA